jgi:hypothetical protein
MAMEAKRRQLLKGISICSAGFLLNAFAAGEKAFGKESEKKEGKKNGEEVTATEDLMREHGVLRRALLVYSETIPNLGGHPSSLAIEMLQRTAKLFRAFGEDYHEKKLEEAYISFLPLGRPAGYQGLLTF